MASGSIISGLSSVIFYWRTLRFNYGSGSAQQPESWVVSVSCYCCRTIAELKASRVSPISWPSLLCCRRLGHLRVSLTRCLRVAERRFCLAGVRLELVRIFRKGIKMVKQKIRKHGEPSNQSRVPLLDRLRNRFGKSVRKQFRFW
jgi:hypothetical protein